MKFTKKKTVDEEWEAFPWADGWVKVDNPNRVSWICITHESQIEEKIPEAPDDLKAYVRKEVRENRPLAENEWRDDRPGNEDLIWRFDVRGGDLFWSCVRVGGFIKAESTPSTHKTLIAAGNAYLAKHKPLADDEVRFDCGTVGKMSRDGGRIEIHMQGRDSRPNTNDRFINSSNKNAWIWAAGKITDETQRQRVRDFAARNRPLESNQVRLGDTIYELRWNHGSKECRAVNVTMAAKWGAWQGGDERADKWFEDNRPLAENEIFGSDGLRRELRWHEGRAEIRLSGKLDWVPRHIGAGGLDDSWFRANCPIDRFVTDSGEVLEFQMTDEGGAECLGARFSASIGSWETHDLYAWLPEYREIALALYKFRDHERGKWEFLKISSGVQVFCDGLYGGMAYFAKSQDTFDTQHTAETPQWVREKARAMCRENDSEWKVEWCEEPERPSGGLVSVNKDGRVVAIITRGFGLRVLDAANTPPHILTQARALFREKRQIGKDEIWVRNKPVKLVFSGNCVQLDNVRQKWRERSNRASWGHGLFGNDTDRLEAFDRCRRFYYEEHPARGVTPDGEPVEFVMDGGVGAAEYVPRKYFQAIRSVSKIAALDSWRPLEEKLIRWTDEQLKKRKTSFEARCMIVGEKADGDAMVAFSVGHGDAKKVERGGYYSVTIEPLEDA